MVKRCTAEQMIGPNADLLNGVEFIEMPPYKSDSPTWSFVAGNLLRVNAYLYKDNWGRWAVGKGANKEKRDTTNGEKPGVYALAREPTDTPWEANWMEPKWGDHKVDHAADNTRGSLTMRSGRNLEIVNIELEVGDWPPLRCHFDDGT